MYFKTSALYPMLIMLKMWREKISNFPEYKSISGFFVYLFLCCSSSALGELAVVVHGGGSAPRGLAALPTLRVQHPPRALPRSLVLDTNKAAVQRQVVSNGVLQKNRWEKSGLAHDKWRDLCLPFYQKNLSSALASTCKSPPLCRWFSFTNIRVLTADSQKRKRRY